MKIYITIIKITLLISLLSCVNCRAVQGESDQYALDRIEPQIVAAFKAAGLKRGKTFSVLPFEGDDARFGSVAQMLQRSVAAAGLTCVINKDDPIIIRLADEIAENNRRIDIYDPSTLNSLGKLKSSQMLIYGSVREVRDPRDRSTSIFLRLQVVSVETKQVIWGHTFSHPKTIGAVVTIRDSGDAETFGLPSFKASAVPLRVAVSTACQAQCEPLASEIARSVENRLLEKDFIVPKDGLPDIQIEMSVEATNHASAVNYFTYEGVVKASLKRLFCKDTLAGNKTFRGTGARALGEEKALLALNDAMGEDIAKWVIATADAARSNLSANDITIARPLLDGTKKTDFEYAEFFVKSLSVLENIISCKIISQDPGKHTMSFRIIYQSDAYPAGLMNKIMTMESLGLNPADYPNR